MTYHEKVAMAMSKTKTVGHLHTYDQILTMLLLKIPDEGALRKLIARYEELAYEAGFDRDEKFIKEEELQGG